MNDEILGLCGTPGISAKIFNMDQRGKIVPKVKWLIFATIAFFTCKVLFFLLWDKYFCACRTYICSHQRCYICFSIMVYQKHYLFIWWDWLTVDCKTSLWLFFNCGAFKFRECLSKVCKRWSKKDSGFFNNIILVFWVFFVYEQYSSQNRNCQYIWDN